MLTFVAVHSSRQGSVITDYVVQMTEFDNDEIAGANKQLPTALGSVAPVIGSIAASYKSKFSETLLNYYCLELAQVFMQHINLLLFFVLCILNSNNNSNQVSFFTLL